MLGCVSMGTSEFLGGLAGQGLISFRPRPVLPSGSRARNGGRASRSLQRLASVASLETVPEPDNFSVIASRALIQLQAAKDSVLSSKGIAIPDASRIVSNVKGAVSGAGENLSHLPDSVSQAASSVTNSLRAAVSALPDAPERIAELGHQIQASLVDVVPNSAHTLEAAVHRVFPPGGGFSLQALEALVSQALPGDLTPAQLGTAVILTLSLVLSIVLENLPIPGVNVPETLPFAFSPDLAEKYFARRPVVVIRRLLELVLRSGIYGLALYSDKRTGKWVANQPLRARQLTELLTVLGPSFIKIGQSLSIRADLLPPPYLQALKDLQDNLPPFPTSEAKELISAELGLANKGGVTAVFSQLSPEPLAAASLGQVYKGKLRKNGEVVAVKVQRPGSLEQITLDLMLVRWLAPYLKKWGKLNTDTVGIVDEWGTRFLEELDYQAEARNAATFSEVIKAKGIESVSAPPVYVEYTTRRVLTTQWVDGVRLDQSDAADVPRLCSVALNCYLLMLLDIGKLHADPHPGNLLRTPDGKLVILDWGLMTEIQPTQREAILSYIAHLTAEEWTKVPADLVNMGFVPASKARAVMEEEDIVQALGKTLAALAEGGGMQKVKSKVEGISDELRAIGRKYGNIFQIPPYFAYVLKTFSILEGISLSNDPSYSIVSKCWPYLARRLFTDESQVSKDALEAFLFKGSGEGRVLNVDRLEKLVNAYSSFAANTEVPDQVVRRSASRGSSSTALVPAGSSSNAAVAASSTEYTTGSPDELSVGEREVLRVLFARNGTHLQTLLIEEAAKCVDVLSRDALAQAFGVFLGTGPLGGTAANALPGLSSSSSSSSPARVTLQGVLGAVYESQRQVASALGPLRPFLLPLPLPGEVVDPLRSYVSLSRNEEETLAALRKIWGLLQKLGQQQQPQREGGGLDAAVAALSPVGMLSVASLLGAPLMSPSSFFATAQKYAPLAPELGPGVQAVAYKFYTVLWNRVRGRTGRFLEEINAQTGRGADSVL
eukprot:jgi/Mesvir1/11764/Mv00132-RA.1